MLWPQILVTCHPFLRKLVVTALSRRLFFSIFVRQKSSLSKCFHLGYCHPCQKSLSKNTQIFSFKKTMSGLPLTEETLVRNFFLVIFFRFLMKSSSNFVFFERIPDINFDLLSLDILSTPLLFLKFLPE